MVIKLTEFAKRIGVHRRTEKLLEELKKDRD